MTVKVIHAGFGQVLLVHVTKIQVVKSVGLLSLGRLGRWHISKIYVHAIQVSNSKAKLANSEAKRA